MYTVKRRSTIEGWVLRGAIIVACVAVALLVWNYAGDWTSIFRRPAPASVPAVGAAASAGMGDVHLTEAAQLVSVRHAGLGDVHRFEAMRAASAVRIGLGDVHRYEAAQASGASYAGLGDVHLYEASLSGATTANICASGTQDQTGC